MDLEMISVDKLFILKQREEKGVVCSIYGLARSV